MKAIFAFLFAVALSGCLNREEGTVTADPTPEEPIIKSKSVTEPPVKIEETKKYSNTRFRNVTIEKLEDGKYRINGEGQIFEANFGWVVEDGHNEIKSGNVMTDAGAPEWGKFDFTFDAKKQRENSVLHLILYETSAKDGSRQHELHIPLN